MPLEVAESPPRHPLLSALARAFGGWPFPVVAMTLLVGFATMVLVVMVVPTAESGFGAFAAEFKRWCFGWDGMASVSAVQVVFMVSELLLFAFIVRLLWSQPLRAGWQKDRRSLLVTFGVAVVGLSSALLILVRLGDPVRAATVFELRTTRPAPALSLTDHLGRAIDLADLRGKVVVVTAVYASCGNTCPMLLGQAKRLEAEVVRLRPEKIGDLAILTITLDAAHDTEKVRAEAAANRGVQSPPWHLLGGDVSEVEQTLDRWEVARRFNPETRQIDHANLFYLVDREGRVAYRLGLSDEREAWLVQAVLELLDEARTP